VNAQATDDLAAPRVAILAFGTLAVPALQAAESLNATVVNMRWAKPLDVDLLLQVASQHDALVTVEEGAIMGGAGSAVTEALNVDCSSVCQMCSLSTATPRSSWPCRAWMRDGIKQAIAKRFFAHGRGLTARCGHCSAPSACAALHVANLVLLQGRCSKFCITAL
jgi:1-deoxy-D-xylulose-5-phosphate synthase